MMVKILLDECLPKKLKYRIKELDSDFVVKTVPEVDWNSLSDGKLLPKAEKEFDVFITSDRNLSFQQTIEDIKMHVVLLIAITNTYEDLQPLVKKLPTILESHQQGQFSQIQ